MENSKKQVISKEEYLMLREEIVHLDSIVNQTVNFFYVFISSYLALVLKQEETLYFLLSYIVILPAYLIVIHKMNGLGRIGAYLKVFGEGERFSWETNNIKFKNKFPSNTFKISACHFPFLFVNVAVMVLYLYSCEWNKPLNLYEIIELIVQILFFISIWILYYRSKKINTGELLDKWVEIYNEIT